IEHPITAANDGLIRYRPGYAEPRSEVVPVRTDARPRYATRSHLCQLFVTQIEYRHPIRRIRGGCVVFISSTQIQGDVAPHFPVVLEETVVGCGSLVLRIIGLRLDPKGWQPEEQIADTAVRQGSRERKRSSRELVENTIQP